MPNLPKKYYYIDKSREQESSRKCSSYRSNSSKFVNYVSKYIKVYLNYFATILISIFYFEGL